MAETPTLLHLIDRAQSDDPKAMTEILTWFRPLIRKLSRSIARSDQEDLEQELSLLLVQIVLKYDPGMAVVEPDRRSSPPNSDWQL